MGKYNCEACKKKCKKQAIRLNDKYFHIECFSCKACKEHLAVDEFFTKENEYYCKKDYQRLFGSKCSACNTLIEDQAITVLNNHFHIKCLKCSKCSLNFHAGEKATLVGSDHLCQSCVPSNEQSNQSPKTPLSSTLLHHNDENGSHNLSISPFINSPNDYSNGCVTLDSSGDATILNDKRTSVKSEKINSKVFGMPENKFYNISYLERLGDPKAKTLPLQPNSKDAQQTHYHRPDNNFSYRNHHLILNLDQIKKKQKDANKDKKYFEKIVKPIERDDWPGPPEPAAAYPELLRDRSHIDSDLMNGNANDVECHEIDGRISRRIDELEKMTDSGTAGVILKELKKKGSSSPILDPRNSSRVPSAEISLLRKFRYEKPYFASPSRYLSGKENGIAGRPATAMGVDRHSDLSADGRYRPGTSLDVYLQELHRRPHSTTAFLYKSDTLGSNKSFDEGSREEIDPTTGLKHFSRLKSSTLPPSAMCSSPTYHDQLKSVLGRNSMQFKTYKFEELKNPSVRNTLGINAEDIEMYLSDAEFKDIFAISRLEFERLPPWQKMEEKTKAGLL